MGLFSKIKKGVKKAFKGVKNVVSKVAKGVKKVAKKVAYAIPGGKQLWKLGTKVGQGITKGLKKVGKGIIKGIGKLGPVGIIAIQAVLSATGLGAPIATALGSLWGSMGNVALAASKLGGVLGALGSAANATFTAVNWAGSTLGAVGDAIIGGGKELLSGNFSPAMKTFGTNITKAFTGEAGMAGVKAGVDAAAYAGAMSDLGVGAFEQAGNAFSGALAESGGTLANLGTAPVDHATELGIQLDPVNTVNPDLMATKAVPDVLPTFETGLSQEQFIQNATQQAGLTATDPLAMTYDQMTTAVEANKPWYHKAGDALVDTGKEFLQDGGKDLLKAGAKSLLSPGGGGGATQMPQYNSSYGSSVALQGLAAPGQAQGLTAAQVGGYRRPYGY